MDSIALHRLLKCSHTFCCAEPTEIPVLSSHHRRFRCCPSPPNTHGNGRDHLRTCHRIISIAITTPERLLVALIPLGSLFMALIPMRDPMVAAPRRWRTG
jgi:hypothetical protein